MALVIDFSKYTPQELAQQIVEDLNDEELKELVKEIDESVQEWEFTAELAHYFKQEVEKPENDNYEIQEPVKEGNIPKEEIKEAVRNVKQNR